MELVLFDFKQTLISAKHPHLKARLASKIYNSSLRGAYDSSESEFVQFALMKDQNIDFKTRVLTALGCYPEGLKAYLDLVSDSNDYEAWPDLTQTLSELSSAGYKLGVYYPTDRPEQLIAILQALHVYDSFDFFLTTPSATLADATELLRQAAEGYREVYVVGDSLYKEIAVANSAGYNSIWLNLEPASITKNAKAISSQNPIFKPKISVSGLLQVRGSLEYLKSGAVQGSQLRVGYYFPNKRRKLEVASKHAFISSARVLYTPILLNLPIESQGEFDVIVQKVSDIYLSEVKLN